MSTYRLGKIIKTDSTQIKNLLNLEQFTNTNKYRARDNKVTVQ